MSIYDNIKSLVQTSLVDWDGKVAAVIFLSGCNFRCGYCSNKELVIGSEKIKSISFKKIEEALEKGREFIDGIVITGGEPSIYPDFPEFCEKIKQLGFQVKIDTNGTNPEMLDKLLREKLVDVIAMDIKTSFEKYEKLVNTSINLEDIKKSIAIVSKFPQYEFRTTLFPEIKKEDLIEIAEYLKSAEANKAFFIHQFRNDTCLDKDFESMSPYSKEELKNFLNLIKGYFVKSGIRNM